MTTPTLAQVQKLLSQLGGWDRGDIQVLLESGILGLLKEAGPNRLRGPGLNRVRSALMSIPQSMEWRGVTTYWRSLEEWNREFELRIAGRDITDIDVGLHHAGPYRPATVCYYSGRGLTVDWTIATDVLRYELKKRQMELDVMVSSDLVAYRGGCGAWSSHPKLSQAGTIDLLKYWKPESLTTVKDALKKERTWPSLEILWLLALNPHVFSEMSKGNFPDLYLPGLQVHPGNVPFIGCYNRTVFINCTLDTEQVKNIALVA